MSKTRSYRNNNPGNLRHGEFSKLHGAKGQDPDGFAIFPTSAQGFGALYALLETGGYRGLTIAAAVHRYAPPSENESDLYVGSICRQTELPPDTVLETLPPRDLASLCWAIAMHEGWDRD